MTRNALALTVAAFDAWPSECAVLAADGMILSVNAAWRRFGDRNGAGSRCGPGVNYLAVTDRAAASGDEVAAVVAAALTAVFTGDAPTARVDYPCHSPHEQRWFRLHAQPLPGRRNVLLVHDDITGHVQQSRLDQKMAVHAALAARRDPAGRDRRTDAWPYEQVSGPVISGPSPLSGRCSLATRSW